MVRKIALIFIALGILLAGCQQATLQATSTLAATGVLTPFQTATSTSASPTGTFQVTIPVTPSPTPTPFLHTLTSDDTMLGLAFRYGVSLEALKTANPSINPNAMSVGAQLVIPINTQAAPEIPTPTAIPAEVRQPTCTLAGDGGAWCIVAVRNNLDFTLENLSVWIGLYDAKGKNFTSQVVYGPMDILTSGSVMPLMAYFSPPLPDHFTARAELLTADGVATTDTRYLAAEAKIESMEISSDGSQAEVNGEVILASGADNPSQVWVLAVAYDAFGNIVGARKWKSAGDTRFDITVYSVVGSISTVELLVEATP